MMKMSRSAGALIAALALVAGSQAAFAANAKKAAPAKKTDAAAAVSYKVDPAASVVKWTGRKVAGPHDGTIQVKSGQVDVKANQLVGGVIEIDMTTIKDNDLQGEWNEKLVGHLKSDDFFGVAAHPTASLKVTGSKPVEKAADGSTHQVTGDLTIKGKTLPIAFPAKVEVKDGKATASGKITIDRTKYDIRYGSGQFFDPKKLADKMIDDNFIVDFQVTGAKL